MNAMRTTSEAGGDVWARYRSRIEPRRVRAALRLGAAATVVAIAGLLGACSPGANINIANSSAADPGTLSYPLAYVKKSIPSKSDDLRVLRQVLPTANTANNNLPVADVYVRPRADPSAAETNITASITQGQPYDIKGLDVSFDGTKLVFAMRGPLTKNMKDFDPPFWRLYQYDFATSTLQPVISSDLIAAEGNDLSPHFLPDGRILFTSTRQHEAKAILLDEGKPQFEAQTEANSDTRNESTFNLHVMNADGSNIHQITFSQAHDRDPTVLVSGRVMWSRWESPTANPGINGDGIHLFTANPDGADVELLYGADSHLVGPANNQPIEYVQSHEMPDGRVLSLVRPFSGTDFGGDLYLIDTKDYIEQYQQPATSGGTGTFTTMVQTADPTSTLAGPAMAPATGNTVSLVPGLSSGGRYSSAYPLWDNSNRILVSWTQCAAMLAGQTVACTSDVLANPAATPAPPVYSVWMYDLGAQAFLPIVTPEPGVMITEAVVAVPRTVPGTTLPNTLIDQSEPTFNQNLANLGVGVVDIRSVYDVDGTATVDIAATADPKKTTAAERPARFVRIEKAVSIPPRQAPTGDVALKLDPTAFGVSNFMEEILGYVPVEPDGSVVVEVPANVSFQITILDVNARRTSVTHHNWLQVMPGERLTCNGCHDPASGKSHGRPGAFPSAYAGFPDAFPGTAVGQPFPNTLTTFTPQAGETMAEARARVTCPNGVAPPGATTPCSQIPSVNVSYTDVWTDPVAAGRPPDASFAYNYNTAPAVPVSPTSVDCTSAWSSTCRIVINYTEHIQPIWSASPRLGPNGAGDGVCIDCHTPANAANVNYLDLTNDVSNQIPTQLNSYVDLLSGSTHTVTTIDPVTQLPVTTAVTVPAVMTGGSAIGSGPSFLDRFAPGSGDPIHAGILYPSELRLISEWLDIGAQYFNNPFDPTAPLN